MGTKIKTFILMAVCWGATFMAFAQDKEPHFDTAHTVSSPTVVQKTSVVHKKPKPPKQISTELSLGFRLNTDGWSLFTDYGTARAIDAKHADRFYNLRFWQFEFIEKKNPKELKSSSGAPSNGGSSTYIFGKINNFYVLKLGYGARTMIAGKPDNQGNVSIHWVNSGGAAVGFLKPYYINVAGDPVAIKYTDATKNDFLNQDLIMGSAGFAKGFSEVKVIPGIHYKSALHFDFSGNMKTILAIEAGINAEYYFQDVQLMANTPATPYFIDIFLSFQIGRRW